MEEIQSIRDRDDKKGKSAWGVFLGMFRQKQSPSYVVALVSNNQVICHEISSVWGHLVYSVTRHATLKPSHEALEELRPYYGHLAKLYVHQDLGCFLTVSTKKGQKVVMSWDSILNSRDLLTIQFRASMQDASKMKNWNIRHVVKDKSEIQLVFFRPAGSIEKAKIS